MGRKGKKNGMRVTRPCQFNNGADLAWALCVPFPSKKHLIKQIATVEEKWAITFYFSSISPLTYIYIFSLTHFHIYELWRLLKLEKGGENFDNSSLSIGLWPRLITQEINVSLQMEKQFWMFFGDKNFFVFQMKCIVIISWFQIGNFFF